MAALNTEHKQRIVEWMYAAYQNKEILRLIDKERRKGVLYLDEPWPDLDTKQLSSLRHSNAITQPASLPGFTIAAELGMATRDGHLKRLQSQIADIEALIDRNNEAIEGLWNDGVLEGMSYPARTDPTILEADYTVDDGRLPALRAPADDMVQITGAPADDPRWTRLMDLYFHQAKLYTVYERMMGSYARTAGLLNQKTEELQVTQQERIERANDALEKIKTLFNQKEREKTPVRRKRTA